MNYLKLARNQYRAWTDAALREAIASSAQLAAAVGGTAVLSFGVAAYCLHAKAPSRLFAGLGIGATVSTAAYAAYKAVDCPADWETWRRLNSGENRAGLATAIAQAQAGQVQRLVMAWENSSNDRADYLSPAMVSTAPPPVPPPVAHDIALSMGRDLRSALVVGQPRSGKGFMVAHAIRQAKTHHPDLTIWVIDPKADPSEQMYWEGCDRILAHPLEAFSTNAEVNHFLLAVDDFVKNFSAIPGPKLLIFDEALGVKEKAPQWFKGLMASFNYLCSTGASRRQYGWMLSQTPNAADFGISGGARNVYRRILMIHHGDLGLLLNKTTFFEGRPDEAILSLTGRAFYDSAAQSWAAAPVYPPLRPGPVLTATSRRDVLESAWSMPALSPDAATVLEYLQRRAVRAAIAPQDSGPIDVSSLAHNLTAAPYKMPRPGCRKAVAELAAARLVELRDGAIALRSATH